MAVRAPFAKFLNLKGAIEPRKNAQSAKKRTWGRGRREGVRFLEAHFGSRSRVRGPGKNGSFRLVPWIGTEYRRDDEQVWQGHSSLTVSLAGFGDRSDAERRGTGGFSCRRFYVLVPQRGKARR